jgi:hypothetical protein
METTSLAQKSSNNCCGFKEFFQEIFNLKPMENLMLEVKAQNS